MDGQADILRIKFDVLLPREGNDNPLLFIFCLLHAAGCASRPSMGSRLWALVRPLDDCRNPFPFIHDPIILQSICTVI